MVWRRGTFLNVDDWKTTEVKPTPNKVWWKRSLGEACPHGREIFLVSGPYIRNNLSSDFVQGDNHYHSPRFVPTRELWLDDSMPEEERPFMAMHECIEAELMKNGMDYERAHDRAKKAEDSFRKLLRPGER